MRLIKNGIGADKLHVRDLSIHFMIDSIQFADYTIFYQDIIKFIRFFIGNKKFEQDLVYTLICQYALNIPPDLDITEDNKKLYGKINIKD